MTAVSAAREHRSRLIAVFCITLVVFGVEVFGGIITGSLALLADAGHMFTDVAGIGLALFAIWLAARPAHSGRTFGMYRFEIIAAAINAVLLFAVAVWVLFEAWERFRNPAPIESGLMLVFATAGLVANMISLVLLHRGQAESLNLRGAYLEVLGDLLGSVAVLVAAAVISLTGFEQADPIASVLIGFMIIPRTWSLLKEAVDILLEATPRGVDLDEVRRHIVETQGVADVHDLHAWTITSGMHVVSAHVVIQSDAEAPAVLDALCLCLADDFDIEHSTFQLESVDRKRLEQAAHS